MLELKNIHISFNKNTDNKIDALNNVNLEFHEHQWSYIIGGNGSGKSTLLKIINKELIPDKGELIFNSYKPTDVMFIDQTTIKNLVPSMTIYENLIFALKNNGMKPNFRLFQNKNYKEIVTDKLKEFNIGLEKRINEQVKFLSGGEQQIIVASRIMLSNPRILLMDEFTSSLDQKWAPFILEKLKKFITVNNIMVIAVTHDYSQIQNIGDRLIMLKNGRVFADKKKENFDFTTQSILNLFYEYE
jgi:putative ABC transport system ATP-binding protein